MKKVIVKSLKGDLLDSYTADDPMPWISDGIKSGRWGLSEREKLIKDCTRFELANVIAIRPPNSVVVGSDYKLEIVDVSSLTIDKEKALQKRKDLVRDWEALHPVRKEKLIKRIMQFILLNEEIEVSDL